MLRRFWFLAFALISLALFIDQPLWARTRLKNLCRVKGQEENTLQGLGMVVGLKGTGDGGEFLPTIRSLATAMQLMGNPIGKGGPVELKNAKNVALVMVTVTVPAAGGRQGDKLDCTVSSIGSAKSLAGGRLFMTAMQGPQVENTRIYAFAEGAVQIDDVKAPTVGRVHNGCRLEEDFLNVFTKDDKLTLVLDKNRADFEIAQAIAEAINDGPLGVDKSELARAINPLNIEVTIPAEYRDHPVHFASIILSQEIEEPNSEARVVINERAGSIVIGANVEIGPVAVSHKNIVVETGPNAIAGKFVAVDPSQTGSTKLQVLVAALNAVKVPTEDIIEIIKRLERSGQLHGWLIIE